MPQSAKLISNNFLLVLCIARVSGITVQRSSSGEGRYAIIRGMNQRYNSTLVNGIKIPSPDDNFSALKWYRLTLNTVLPTTLPREKTSAVINLNVEPGHYTFRVKSVNGKGDTNGKEATLIIKIPSSVWASPFAYIFYVILGPIDLAISERLRR